MNKIDKQCLPRGGFEQLIAMPGTYRKTCKCYLSLFSKVIPEFWEMNTKKNQSHFISPKLNASTSTWKKIEEY